MTDNNNGDSDSINNGETDNYDNDHDIANDDDNDNDNNDKGKNNIVNNDTYARLRKWCMLGVGFGHVSPTR